MRAVGAILLFLAGVTWTVPAALAQAGGRAPSCMDCHQPRDTTIEPVKFAHSVHRNLDCAACHTEGFETFPHKTSRATMPDCIDCHSGPATPPVDFDKIAAGVKASVHAKLVDPAFRCTNCHNPHYFSPASRLTDASEATLAANKPCLGCHAGGEAPAARDLSFRKLANKHRLLFHAELHLERNMCVACHTPRGQQTVHDILPKSEALTDCSVCHSQNSMLVTKLYSHLAVKERADHGWANAILFNNSYLSGATRNRWLDWGTLGLTGLVFLGVGAHGIGRWLFASLRRKS